MKQGEIAIKSDIPNGMNRDFKQTNPYSEAVKGYSMGPLKNKSYTHKIWLISLEPTIGAEIKKTRPSVVVSDDGLGKLPLKIVVPINDWKDKYQFAKWMVKIKPNAANGLNKDSSADCFQVRSVSEERFVKRLGHVDGTILAQIRTGLSIVLSINN